MTAPEGRDYRQRLLQWRQALGDEQRQGESSARTVELDQSRLGRISRMDALQGQAMSQQAARRRLQLQRRIDLALERLEQGEFGDCLECGQAISEGRLDIDPATELCIRCADLLESGRQPGGGVRS
jgi:DnaK suppressor protein